MILTGICQKLQLSPTLYEQADSRYHTIAEVIDNDQVFSRTKIKIYPQGSFRLKTTVKPLSESEYDLDFVAELPIDSHMTPNELYDNIYRILSMDGRYKQKVEKKSRCIRVNYSNDFHLDIMPGKLINPSTKEIVVPDKKTRADYHNSNPIAYAEWFEEKARNRVISEINCHKFKATVEKVTEQELAKHLEPLRRATQLIKRYRDLYCTKTNSEPVRSIVICTLLGQISKYSSSTLDIISLFCAYVQNLIDNADGVPFTVCNPVVDEILTEKWSEDKNYKDFVNMIKALSNDINKLKTSCTNTDINGLLKEMFGEKVTNEVILDYASKISNERQNNNLYVSPSGIINTNKQGTNIPKNTFWGVEDKI